MRHIRAYLATEDPVTPQALEILSKVKAEVIGDSVTIDFLPAHDRLPDKATVFALGKYRAENPSVRVVPAPSVAQIVSHAGIVTRLGQAFQLLVQPPELPEFKYKVLNYWKAVRFLNSRRGEVFAYDLEWSGDDDEPDYSRLLGAGFYEGTRAYVIPEDVIHIPEVHDALKGFLEGNAVVTVNGKGDLSYTPHARVPVESHFDCMLAHYVLWPTLEHGLKPVTKHMFGFDDWDEATKPYRKGATYDAYEKFEDGSWHDARTYSNGSGFERIPRAMLYEYLGFDVYATWHWFVRMREMLAADEDAMKAFKFLMRLSDMFMDVEARGIRLDVEYLEELSTTLQVEKTFAEIDLNKIAGKEINPRSPKQVKEWFAEQGVELSSTNEATLKEFIEEEDDEAWPPVQFAEQLLVCRGLTKTLGTYVDGYRNQADENGYVYPGYKLSTSTTGRLGGRGASMLTIPREKRLKRMVVADPGMVMVGADLSQAELRVMAVESMDQWLIDAFQPGAGDFFDLLLGQAYPDIDWVALHKKVSDHEATEDEANFYNNKRASMKGVVYGVSFGRGVKAIAAALKISIAEAQRLVDAFVRPGSAFALWREDISRKALAGDGIVTKFGRHFQSELVTRVNRQNVINSALSFTSQSTANDICLLATLEVVKQLPDYGYRLMGTVHDAIYTTGPAENKEVVGKLLTESLAWAGREVYGDLVPFDSDWGYGESMADI
jgi:DNA polymerase I-like protein with 3'-5' exonuclease and polymerase domains